MITGYEVSTGEPETGLRVAEPWRRTLITLELLLSVAGTGGGLYLMALPHSAMPIDLLASTPFPTWFWPGVALALVNGLLPLTVAVGAIRAAAWASPGHLVVGVGLVSWIVVQVAVIGFIGWLQPTMLIWGLTIAALGWINYRF